MTDQTLSNLIHEDAPLRAAGRARGERQRQGRGLRRGPTPTPRRSGRSRPSGSTGTRSGTGCSTGTTRRSPSGSSAAASTRRTTASTGTSAAGKGDKVALHWVGEPADDTRDITYAELKDQVCQAANALTDLGVQTGDRVAIYMPMIPETVVAMLACARIGAPHTVVFGGFSRRRARHPGRRLRGQGDHHRRRRLPARRPVGAQAGRRRGRRQGRRAGPDGRQGAGRAAYRARTSTGTTSRDVWWHDAVDGASTEHECESFDSRAPALRHVHLRHHRQAEGHPAHHRRLPRRHVVDALGGLRPQGRHRRLLVHRRRRLGDRPLLHGLRPALQRRRRRWSTKGRPTPRTRAAGGRSSSSTASRSSTPRPRRSARS